MIAAISELVGMRTPRTTLVVFAPLQALEVFVRFVVAVVRSVSLTASRADLLIAFPTQEVSCWADKSLSCEGAAETAVQPLGYRCFELLLPRFVRRVQFRPGSVWDVVSEILEIDSLLTPVIGIFERILDRLSEAIDHRALKAFTADAVFLGIGHAHTVGARDCFVFGADSALEDIRVIG